MKVDEKALERLLKRILRGEQVDFAVFEATWRGLGASGDRFIIRTLNRLNGWDKFGLWAADHTSLRELLERLVIVPGISEKGLNALQQQRHDSNDVAVREALRIANEIEKGSTNSLIVSDRLKSNEALFEGVLILLELSNSESASKFLQSLLYQNVNKDQESRIRKLLYLFRQKGIRPEATTRKNQIDRELFFFSENKLPLWQPLLYFNPHSAFSSIGDLLILRILEGSECSPPEQQPNLTLNQHSLEQIAEKYAAQLEKQLGLQLRFYAVSPAVGRYLLHASAVLMSEANRAKPLIDFLKFIGSDPMENPFEKLHEASSNDVMSADLMLRDPYFAHWMLSPHDMENYLNQLTQLEKGPIILTGGPLIARQQELIKDFLRNIFSPRERTIWSFVFRKAAFYLHNSNPGVSSAAMFYAKQFDDPDVPSENIEVARALFSRALEIARVQQNEKQEEERKTSLIVTPDQLRKRS